MFKRSGLVASGVLIAACMPYSATKTDTPIMETARPVSVLDEQSMKDKGAMSVSDALMYTAGVTGQPYGFATRVDSYTVRGLDIIAYRVLALSKKESRH